MLRIKFDKFYEIDHIKEHHADVTGEKVNCNEIISSSGISDKENNSKNTPHGCEVLKCDICSFSCFYKSRLLKHKIIHTYLHTNEKNSSVNGAQMLVLEKVILFNISELHR